MFERFTGSITDVRDILVGQTQDEAARTGVTAVLCGSRATGGVDVSRLRAAIGEIEIFSEGAFRLNQEKEKALTAYLKGAELYASGEGVKGVFAPPVDFPRHERCVEIDVDLGSGDSAAAVLGGDLTHEYVSENADYRS